LKALIIAAGKGRRLNRLTKGRPKALVDLLGLSLIERVILSAKEAGVREFLIVVGYEAEKVREKIGDGGRFGIRVEYALNPNWNGGNGGSVLAAKGLLNEEFFLLMGDHLFDPKILLELKEKKGCVLCIDRSRGHVDEEEATKVKIDSQGRLVEIGKDLKEYDGLDCGIFLCSPIIFDALEESAKRGDDTLSGGVRVLAEMEKISLFDIGGRFWLDVDTESDYRRARRMILSQYKGKEADGLISHHLNRPLSSRLFTPFIIRLYKDVTPNQVSLLSFFVGVAGAVMFFLLQPVIGGVLVQLASILDGCDGEIARLKHLQSKIGDFFDAVLDRYVDSIILLGIFYYSVTKLQSGLFEILIGGAAIAGNLMVSYTSAKAVLNLNYRYKGIIATGRGRDLRLFIIFIGGVLGGILPHSPFLALCGVALLTNLIVLARVVLSWKIFSK
jgi:CDP-L-myo-inositol myo-inositolphosphotransferase